MAVVSKLFKDKREDVQNAMQEAYEQDLKIEAEITARWDSDNKGDSWLAKNVRPLTLIEKVKDVFNKN